MGCRVGARDGTGDDGVKLGVGEGDRSEEEGSGLIEGAGTETGTGDGAGELGCGVGADVALTVTDNFWPLLQWPGMVQMK